MKITTNNVPRDVLYWHDLTDAERKEFDYLDTEDRQNDASFVRYKGWCYDMGEFERVPNVDGTANNYNSFQGWDGYHSDSFFSGVLLRWSRVSERADTGAVVMGYYTC